MKRQVIKEAKTTQPQSYSSAASKPTATRQALPTLPTLSPTVESDILACTIYAHLGNRETSGVFQEVLSQTMIAKGILTTN